VEQGASASSAIARYIFHPSIQIKQLSQDQWELLLPNQKNIAISTPIHTIQTLINNSQR
jgi:hypothetical protein